MAVLMRCCGDEKTCEMTTRLTTASSRENKKELRFGGQDEVKRQKAEGRERKPRVGWISRLTAARVGAVCGEGGRVTSGVAARTSFWLIHRGESQTLSEPECGIAYLQRWGCPMSWDGEALYRGMMLCRGRSTVGE